jgi:subtilisin family serine protease
MAFLGQTLCVCGEFPGSSADSLLIDGIPLGTPLAASGSSRTFQIPPNLTIGPHRITGMPEAGFSPFDVVVVTLLELVAEIDQQALLTGQSTTARFRVRGATDRLQLDVTNKTPQTVNVQGGAEQHLLTSGGANNEVQRRVRGLAKGAFSLQVALAAAACACTAKQPEDPRGFLPARVAALIPLAAPAAMAATAQAIAAANGFTVLEITPLPSSGDGLVVFSTGAIEVLNAVASLNADARVTTAEPDFLFETDGSASPPQQPEDALRYGPRLIGIRKLGAFGASLNGRDVVVALIDTGVDIRHPQLAGHLKQTADATSTSYKSGIHGTLVAGIVADLAPRASLLSIQACLPPSEQAIRAKCSTVTLAKALDVAIRKKAHVINLSLGGPHSRIVERLILQAVKNGAVIVAAAGNGGPDATPSFPAALDAVIAVTAIDVSEAIYPYATRGGFIDLAAPGVDILSTAPRAQRLLFSGTSAAAPHVTGVAALLLQKPRSLNPAAAQQILESAASDLGPRGKDPQFGSGRLDAFAALSQAAARNR